MHDEQRLELSPSATRIRDAARALTMAGTFADVTIADVARRSEVNEVTVYRIFGSRDGLAAACWSTNMEPLKAGIARDRTRFLDAVDRIASHLRRLARVAVNDRQITYAMIQAVEAASMDSGATMGVLDPRRIVPLPPLATPLIADAQTTGAVRDDYPASDLASFLTNSLLLRVLTRPGHSARDVSAFVVDVTLSGILIPQR